VKVGVEEFSHRGAGGGIEQTRPKIWAIAYICCILGRKLPPEFEVGAPHEKQYEKSYPKRGLRELEENKPPPAVSTTSRMGTIVTNLELFSTGRTLRRKGERTEIQESSDVTLLSGGARRPLSVPIVVD